MKIKNRDVWQPACGGQERPFTIRGRRLLYMWNVFTGEHAYIDLDTDIFLTPEEVDCLFNQASREWSLQRTTDSSSS